VLAGSVVGSAATAVLAGAYPAFILSSFKPPRC
jgi:hypothetical protein